MSQAGVLTSSGTPPPPGTDITFDLDDGMTTSVSSVMIIVGVDSTEDNDNGILTRANPNLSDNTEIVLTNRFLGTATVVGATTGDIITFDLGASVAVYRFDFDVAGIDTVSGEGVGYRVQGTARTDGATAIIVELPDIDGDEDVDLVDVDIDLIASGNNIILRGMGQAGASINYKAYGSYVKAT